MSGDSLLSSRFVHIVSISDQRDSACIDDLSNTRQKIVFAAAQKDWNTVSSLVSSGVDAYTCDTSCDAEMHSSSVAQFALEDKQWQLVYQIWQTSIMFDDVAHDPYTTHALEPIVLIAARHRHWDIVAQWMDALGTYTKTARAECFSSTLDTMQHTLLWYACRDRKWAIIVGLLVCGATDHGVRIYGEDNDALIMIAAQQGTFLDVSVLLSVHPDVSKLALPVSISWWDKLVYWASEANQWRLLRILCGRGMDARLLHTMIRQKPVVHAAMCQEWTTVLYMLRCIMKHFSCDTLASFLRALRNTTWLLDDATKDSQTTESMLVLLACKAKQWGIVSILIKFFNADPNASYAASDELQTSVFGMAALSRQWHLCAFLFPYQTRVTPQNIDVQQCILLQWFVDTFQWQMVLRMVQSGYVCILANQHPQCRKIYSEILQTAIENQQWKLVHAMLTNGIEANALLIAESIKYDDMCVQDYVCRRLYGSEFEEFLTLDTHSVHDSGEIDRNSAQSYDVDDLSSVDFEEASSDIPPNDDVSYGSQIDDESMQSLHLDIDMHDVSLRILGNELNEIASDAESSESFDADEIILSDADSNETFDPDDIMANQGI
jgi:hypothetical protein